MFPCAFKGEGTLLSAQWYVTALLWAPDHSGGPKQLDVLLMTSLPVGYRNWPVFTILTKKGSSKCFLASYQPLGSCYGHL